VTAIPETTKTTVHQGENGQYKTTIPKPIADGLKLKDQKVEWRIKSGNKLEAKILDE
jgi:hypothetical protein